MDREVALYLALGTCSVLLSLLAFRGKMTSRGVFILMPAITLVICSLTLLADAQHPWLPYVALTMVVLTVAMLFTIEFFVVAFYFYLRSAKGRARLKRELEVDL